MGLDIYYFSYPPPTLDFVLRYVLCTFFWSVTYSNCKIKQWWWLLVLIYWREKSLFHEPKELLMTINDSLSLMVGHPFVCGHKQWRGYENSKTSPCVYPRGSFRKKNRKYAGLTNTYSFFLMLLIIWILFESNSMPNCYNNVNLRKCTGWQTARRKYARKGRWILLYEKACFYICYSSLVRNYQP